MRADVGQTLTDLPTTAKIALVSDDGITLHRHFGHAQNYLVVTLENGQIMGQELRPKSGHVHHEDHDHGHDHEHEHGQGRGQGQGHNHDHSPMLASIIDCQVIIAGGMGFPVVEAIQAQGMALVLLVETDISRILADYLAGNLVNNPRLAHRPGHHGHD